VRATTLQKPRSVNKEGKEVLCPPAAHGDPWCSRSPPAAHGGHHARAGGCLKEAMTPWKARAGAGSWQDLWREEPTLEQVCWQDLSTRGGSMLDQSVPEGLHPVGRTHVAVVHGGLSPVGGTPLWSRGGV